MAKKSSSSNKRSLSAFDRVASLELEDERASKLRKKKGNQNVAQAKAARSQTKIYSHLMETRILLQRNLQQPQSLAATTSTSSTVAEEECDKLLQQLLQARRTLLQWEDDDEDESTLESEYSKCQARWTEVLNRRHQDLRLHSGLAQQQQFKVVDSSFWQQVENTVAHGEMRQQQQQQDPNASFDDAKIYQQMLKEFVASSNSYSNIARNDNGAVIQQSKNLAANNKKKVDRRASKGRKIRYVEIPKLVNFCFPVSKNM
jgi:Apoptosis-antagonizing transcription factor, C-terminal